MVHRVVAFALFAGVTAIATGCADQPGRPPVVHHPLMYSTYAGDVVAPRAPPASLAEPSVRPRIGYLWARGYWRWNGHDYVAVPGQWLPERPDYRYVDARWERHGDGWHFRPGWWAIL